MRRALIVIGVIILLVLPLALWIFKNPALYTLLPSILQPHSQSVSARFSVANRMPGYSLKLVDTAYLEYVAAYMGIFSDKAIVDPQSYRKPAGTLKRYTVSRVQFVLMPTIDQFLLALSGKKEFAGRGDYVVEGDTLVIKVSVSYDEQQGFFTKKFSTEDAFLRTAFQTLYYAHGLSDDGVVNAQAFAKIKTDMTDNLYGGVFPWPVRIDRVQ